MRDKKETLDKDNEKLKLKKRAKKQKLQERGITLIALVVTIIILLILAGVTLNIALSDNGLFGRAKKAAEDYKQAQSEEEDLISQIATQMYSEYVGATVEGYTLTQKEVTIKGTTSGLTSNKDDNGNVIANDNINENDGNQTFTTEEMTWRVWDFDGNTLRIIGDPTSQKLTLKGVAGYNNGVWAINEICEKLYSNSDQGVTATNLKRTDIQKVSTYDYTKYKHNGDNWDEVKDNSNGIRFGESKTYDNENSKYPKMWEFNDKDWNYEYDEKKITKGDKVCKIWEVVEINKGQMDNNVENGSNSTTFKQSYYTHVYNRDEFLNSSYYDLIFKNSSGKATEYYWLAGRFVQLLENNCTFGIQGVDSQGETYTTVIGNSLYSSNGIGGIIQHYLRPIVSIDLKNSGCTMETVTGEDGKIQTCKLSWK